MLYHRPKSNKSQTPTRHIQSNSKLPHVSGMAKKSDPFLRDLKDINEKQNINPNIGSKDNRVKSQSTKNQYQRSPKTKLSKPNKTYNHQAYYAIKPSKHMDNQHLNSTSKGTSSAELHRSSNRVRTSNRKSTEKDQNLAGQLQEEYFNAKEERHAKKMRVTLKDIKKRKSVHQEDDQFFEGETKDSLTLVGSLKRSLARSQAKDYDKMRGQGSAEKEKDFHCKMHPEKKASHRLVDEATSEVYCQKCAVVLVTKGHKMEQLHPNPRMSIRHQEAKEERLDRLKDFLFSLDRMDPVLKQTRVDITSYRACCIQKYEQERMSLESYFLRLKDELEITHQRCLFNLKMYYESVGEELEKNQVSLHGISSQIEGIKDDILPNINLIVAEDRVGQQQFRQIIENYERQVGKVDRQMTELASAKYCCYVYDYNQKHQLLVNFRDMVSPSLGMQNACDSLPLETNRNKQASQDSSSEKRSEYFRLSFGKDVSDSNFQDSLTLKLLNQLISTITQKLY